MAEKERIKDSRMKGLIEEKINDAVPGLLLLLNVISREYYGRDFLDIYLNDIDTAIKVVMKFAGNDEELAKRLLRIIVDSGAEERQ